MARRIAIALLRNDLRVSDNPILYAARDAPGITHLLPLFVFDERQVELSGVVGLKEARRSKGEPLPEARTRICGFWRTGRHRARFLVQSVFDLKSQLKSMGSDLGVYLGRPENVVPCLVHQLRDQGDTIEGVWLQRELPDVFTTFRKRVEGLNEKMVRPVLPNPSKGEWKPFPMLEDYSKDAGTHVTRIFPLPSDMTEDRFVEQLTAPLVAEPLLGDKSHGTAYHEVPGAAFPFKGGESFARQRLDYYLGAVGTGENCPATTYKETRNGLLGADYSTKFSPYLTFGCLSAREIAARCDDLEGRLREAGKLTDTARKNIYWIKFELLWRDYMFFVSVRYGNDLFKPQGLSTGVSSGDANPRSDWTQWESRDDNLQAWFEGRTGVPFVDACMRELTSTGYMSNRGRQNVASYLTKDLYFDWRIGAEFFESFLLDYDPASNYGNWAYVAGVGNDPREGRKFNVIKQAKDYDPDGEYVKQWVPEVSGSELSGFQRHIPWRIWSGAEENNRSGSYPRSPVVEDSSWKKFYSDGDRKQWKHGEGGSQGGRGKYRGRRGRGRGRGRNSQGGSRDAGQ
ncbi:DNA photolyase, FAD-binding/Cryptochrome [Rhizoctonia solani]|nr:DNA photolyase, FAD-binding/Cryptochrome [Rhizoctonia solani]